MNPPLYDEVHQLSIDVVNASSEEDTEAEWIAYNKLRELCELNENTEKNHPIQWEALADFTTNDDQAIAIYQKALHCSELLGLAEYSASIYFELANRFQDSSQNGEAFEFAHKANELAKETNQYFVNYRWLGGMLTNWGTISGSIKKMKKYEADLVAENRGFTKKELLKMSVKKDKLERSLGGIAEMKKIPDLVFIIDTNYESLAIKESIKLRIPIVAILDSNSDPEGIEFPIPGNDDARRSIDLYCSLIKETIQNAKKAAPVKVEEKPVTKDKKKAEEQVENMCKKLLANLVIEDYRIIGSQ